MRSFFLLIIPVLLSGKTINAQNLISNPGFEEGLAGWSKNQNNGAIVKFIIEETDSPEGEKHLKTEVTVLGSNDWDIQQRSNEFSVNETSKDRLTFKAKSETPAAGLKVYIQKDAWMGKAFTLSDTWTTYTYEFFPNEAIKQLKFNFTDIATYHLDSIILEDITPVSTDFNTPPSCVITAPHVNAYFKVGREVVCRAYAADWGGSGTPGEISSVAFYVDDVLVGKESTTENNTYSCLWQTNAPGEFRLTAVATDTSGLRFTSAGVVVQVGTANAEAIGLSAGRGKYLGNVVRNEGVEPTFTDYWNGATSCNGGKWQTVERTRDVMNWQTGDMAYRLAADNHLPYRYHTLAWGSQYPAWITTLEPAEFQEEMEEFISAVADRYPYIDQIDVINEALPGHQEDTKYFIEGLGGAGESGYDWAVWLFKKARQYFPDSKLVLNDFAMVNSSSNIREQLLLLEVLRDSALVDGFGAQAHTFNMDHMKAADLEQNLDLMAGAGVPLYITEMDMQGVNTDETSQLLSYQALFPVLWEHPAVAGITLWGYVNGDMWQPDAGIVNADGTERSSMIWLRGYLEGQEDVGFPFAADSSEVVGLEDPEFRSPVSVFPNPSKGIINLQNNSGYAEQLSIYDFCGRRVAIFELPAYSSVQHSLSSGLYVIRFLEGGYVKLIVD